MPNVVPTFPRPDDLITVYKELCSTYRAIDDFRAKLLGFLPLATGTGLFLLVSDADKLKIAQQFFLPIGAFGFAITLGLFFYELYGIKKCTRIIEIGKRLEDTLSIEWGQFGQRAGGVLGLINEPTAAAIIYPSVLAAWTYLAFVGSAIQVLAKLWAVEVFLVFFLLALLANPEIRHGFHRKKTKSDLKRSGD